MVGNSNTRWHWNTKDGSPEPTIPWDAHVFPDGTPISWTEAMALLQYTTGEDNFLYYDKFLSGILDLKGDQFLTVPVGTRLSAARDLLLMSFFFYVTDAQTTTSRSKLAPRRRFP